MFWMSSLRVLFFVVFFSALMLPRLVSHGEETLLNGLRWRFLEISPLANQPLNQIIHVSPVLFASALTHGVNTHSCQLPTRPTVELNRPSFAAHIGLLMRPWRKQTVLSCPWSVHYASCVHEICKVVREISMSTPAVEYLQNSLPVESVVMSDPSEEKAQKVDWFRIILRIISTLCLVFCPSL